MRAPSALRLLAAAVLVALLVTAGIFVKILVEDLPPEARAPAIEKRFPAQLAFLRGMASAWPARECSPEEEDRPTGLPGLGTLMEGWAGNLAQKADLFDDPAILGASINCYLPGDTTIRLMVKDWEEPPFDLSRTQIIKAKGWPRVSLWYTSGGRVARYENVAGDGRGGGEKGYELVLDAGRLEER